MTQREVSLLNADLCENLYPERDLWLLPVSRVNTSFPETRAKMKLNKSERVKAGQRGPEEEEM